MSTATSKKLSPEGIAGRRKARQDRREERRAKASARRAWFYDRKEAGKKRAAIQAKAARSGPRGVDRVPDNGLDGTEGMTELVTAGELGVYKGKVANHATRRAMGQRGHQKRPRLRELPGAQARRVERNQKAWSE